MNPVEEGPELAENGGDRMELDESSDRCGVQTVDHSAKFGGGGSHGREAAWQTVANATKVIV